MPLPTENEVAIKLPHPYLASYAISRTERKTESGAPLLQIKPLSNNANNNNGKTKPLPEPLHSDALSFTEPADLKSSERPPESNNTPWGRARRAPSSTFVWGTTATPTLAQAWLLVYVLFTIRPSTELLRLSLSGNGADGLAEQLKAVLLAVDHPARGSGPRPATKTQGEGEGELILLRSAFWQGAGSPFGPRPVWVPDHDCQVASHANGSADDLPKALSQYPPAPLSHTMTTDPSGGLPTAWHPRRAAKPRPGSVVYSRWIPHLGETFSMVALDWQSEEHLNLFHTWQNDPRVSQGWNETGTLDQHREYLRLAHEDPHQSTLLARFDDAYFAYFEVYWAKEDRLGAYYDAGDYDRGRHSLVGEVRFRGPHRVTAWWSSLVHYLFLDDARTAQVVGEPKWTNGSVLTYDLMNGFGLDKLVDLPHKRSAFVRCSRERFFQLAPLAEESDKVVGGTRVGLLPKL